MIKSSRPPFIGEARRCRMLLGLIALLLVLTIAGALVWMVVAPESAIEHLMNDLPTPTTPLSTAQGWALLVISLLRPLVWLVPVLWLRHLFNALTQDHSPTQPAINAGRQAVLWMWSAVIWSLLAPPISSLLVTMHNPSGQHMLTLVLGDEQFFALLAAVITTALAQAMRIALVLWQENREII